MDQQPAGPRCLMWVDGVGGYLVCLSDQVRIGQAIAAPYVDVPVLADLSRHHATLNRRGEVYVLEPIMETWLNERPLASPGTVRDGDTIRLGKSFAMRFRQPHPLSATARLEFISSHRTQPAADGVLLMAGSCVLGPKSTNHVHCRGWAEDLVLVRQGQTLACHSGGPLEVDGKMYDRRAAIGLDSRIRGNDFCVSLERFR